MSRFPSAKTGDYVEAGDDLVTFYRKDGRPFMLMPREDYDAILEEPPDELPGGETRR